ncbi:MAG: M48 family metalloprotease, partial [Alphaproteobacteria bacterium]|nr:M48 family metalloprotease [Alphaproteobacteria bacterium]
MVRWLKISALLPALWLVAACSTNPATGKQSFTAFMSKEDELRIGAEEHPKMIKEFGGAYTDAKLRAYIRRIGIKLASVSEARDLPYTFTILNDDKVNAFALPGGYVYITRGLLALAENEAEMAGVLAHEIGHVAARHTAERYSTAMATNLGLMLLGAIGSSAGLPSGVGRIIGFGAQAALQGYSREQELEADMLGVRYMTRAGYTPDGMTSFFYKMQTHAELERAMEGKKG